MAREIEEFDIQRAFTIWFKGEKRKDNSWKTYPAQRPEVVAWHTPNGGSRVGGSFEGMRLNQIGLEAGIHDYLFLWGGLYGMEFKKRGGVLSHAQTIMHPRLLAAGMVASATVDNLQQAKETVINWGLTVNAGGDSIR